MRHSHLLHSALRVWPLLAALALGLAALALRAPAAHAATIAVTTTADEVNADGDCSLREAIIAANEDRAVDSCLAGGGADTISLPAGTYVLSLLGTGEEAAQTGDLDITEDLTIAGDGRATTTIDAAGIDRALHLMGGTLQLSELTIQNGFSGSSLGTGIYVGPVGSLTLTRVRMTGNNGNSGVVYFSSAGGALTVSESRFDNNGGAGSSGIVIGAQAAASITDSVISGNAANNSGGGIANYGVLYLVNSTVSGNSATRNGGGIFNEASPAIPGSGTAHLRNVTIANNTADSTDDGAGEGGGIFIENGTVNVADSIIANNVDSSSTAAQHPDCSGTLSSQGHNLIEDTAGCVVTGDATGNLIGVSPGLAPLQGNGGQTQTHALLLLSPAIDAGSPRGCLDQHGAALITDQRGYARPIDGDSDGRSRCDMGAFEANSPGAPTPTQTATRTPTATSTATRTHTATATATSTPANVLTATAQASITPSATLPPVDGTPPTATPTPTATSTPANVLTATAQASITPSATRTPGEGPDPEASPTPTAPAGELFYEYLPVVSR